MTTVTEIQINDPLKQLLFISALLQEGNLGQNPFKASLNSAK